MGCHPRHDHLRMVVGQGLQRTPGHHDHDLHGTRRGLRRDLLENMDSVLLDNISLIAIGFLIYGPVMLIGVQALDLAPKKAAGTAAGLTGFFGYFFGTAILANIAMGSIVQHLAGTGDSSCCSRRAHWPSSSSASHTGKNNIWLNNGNSEASRQPGRPPRSGWFPFIGLLCLGGASAPNRKSL